MTMYQSPSLSVEELIDYLSCTDFHDMQVTAEDIKKPTSARWKPVYIGLFEHLTRCSFEEILQAHKLKVMDKFDYPEICEESNALMLITFCMRHVMAKCGVNDFTIKDITAPTTLRLKRNLSALINLAKHSVTREDVFYAFKERNEDLKDRHQNLLRVNDELRSKINQRKAASAEQEPEINRLKEKRDALTAQMNEYYKDAAGKQTQLDGLKTDLAEQKAGIDKIKLQLIEDKKYGDNLSRQIVQSPVRLKETRERMEDNVDQLKHMKENHRQRLLELKEEAERHTAICSEAEHGLNTMKEINAVINNSKAVDTDVLTIQDQIETQKGILRNLNAQEQELNIMLAAKKDKISKVALQNKNGILRQSLAQLRDEKENVQMQQKEEDGQKLAHKQHRQRLLDELEQVSEVHSEKIDSMKQLYASILEKLDESHEEMAAAWGELKQVVQKK